MKLITERILILGVADQWEKEQIGSPPIQSKKDILDKLREIDLKTATSEDIIKIIGRGVGEGWVEVPMCTECNQSSDVVIEIGEPPFIDSSTVTLCIKCLKEALYLAGVWCDGDGGQPGITI